MSNREPGRDEPHRGPTGKFPAGKHDADDEGELDAAVGHEFGKVVIDFGTPVAWVAMGPDEARGLARSLIKHAGACDGKPFTLEL
jgi:hypothetical protein